MDAVAAAVACPVPHLEDDAAAVRPVVDVFVVEAGLVRRQRVIVPEAQEQGGRRV